MGIETLYWKRLKVGISPTNFDLKAKSIKFKSQPDRVDK